MAENYKLLNVNSRVLVEQKLLPGADIPVLLEKLQTIHIGNSSHDGLHVVYKHGATETVLGSQYSEDKFVDRQLAGLELQPMTYYAMLGFDSGAYIKRVLDLMPKSSHLLCVEPCPEQFYKLCMHKDVHAVLSDKRLTLILCTDMQKFGAVHVESSPIFRASLYEKYKFLSRTGAWLGPGVDQASWRDMVELRIKDAIMYNIYTIHTVDASISNYYINMSQCLSNQDWPHVLQACADKPLVLIGMGPSMAFAMEDIRRAQGHCYIGCVDNALLEVLHHGVKPDFVFAVEWQEVSLDFYAGVDLPNDITLVCLPGICPQLLTSWQGPVLTYPSQILKDFWGDLVNLKVPLFAGNNVGMLALQFAIHVGFNPVYLVGFDYCAPMANYNHPNAAYVWNLYPDFSRFWSVEKTDYLYVKNHGMLKEEATVDGGTTYTLHSMLEGKLQMEQLLRERKGQGRFVNCSPYGVQLEGVRFGSTAELRVTLAGLDGKQVVSPNRHSVSPQLLQERCQIKLEQVQRYFSKLGKVHDLACQLQGRFQSADTMAKTARSMMAEFYKALEDLRIDPSLAWIEQSMIQLDRRLLYLVEVDKLARQEHVDDMERMKHMLGFFLKQYAILSSYHKYFVKLLADMLAKLP